MLLYFSINKFNVVIPFLDGDEDDDNEVEDFEENNLQHSNKIIAKYDIKVNHISENNFDDPKHSNKADR